MNTVIFPGLNLNFEISQIAFKIFGIEIYYYAICIVCGIVLSMFFAIKAKEKFGIDTETLLEVLIVTLISGILGARLYYVAFNFEYYSNNLWNIFNIRDGGLAIYGGIIFGIIISIIWCKKKYVSAIDLFDYISPYLALSQAIGRIGNFFNVEAYGVEANNFLRMGIYENNQYAEVHPCFLYECIACFIIFIILRIMQNKRNFKGQVFSLYLILYGIARFFIEGLRADSLLMFNLKISQIISVILAIVGFYLIIHNRNVEKNRNMKMK